MQNNISHLVTVIGCVKQNFILPKKSEWFQLCYLNEYQQNNSQDIYRIYTYQIVGLIYSLLGCFFPVFVSDAFVAPTSSAEL